MNIPYRKILKERNYSYILLGRLFKRSALILFNMELIWFTMELTGNSPFYLSLMIMAETLPFIIFGIYGGVKADKWNKKRVMVISDIGIALLIIAIPLLYSIGLFNYYILMIIAVGITLFSCFAEPSFRAILPELLTKNKLQEGNALLDSVHRGAGILAPASLGFVLKLTTEIHLFSLAFILMSVAAILHLLIKYLPKVKVNSEEQSRSALNDIKYTLGYLKKIKIFHS